LVWLKNVYISNIDFDKINHCYLYKGNKCGFVFKGHYSFGAGSKVYSYRIISAIFDSLIYIDNNWTVPKLKYPTYEKFEKIEDALNKVEYYAIKVINEGYVNYLTINSSIADRPMHTLFLNNTFKDEELSYAGDGVFIINQIGKPLQLYNVVDSTYMIIIDEQGKALILDKAFNFEENGRDSIGRFLGRSIDNKEIIMLFINVYKKQNSLIFKDTINTNKYDFELNSIYKQVRGLKDAYVGADNQIVQQTVFTAFILIITDRFDKLSTRDFTLVSFPDKKVVYNTSFDPSKEKIEINYPNPEKLECCCPYFQIVKFVTKDDKYNTTKKQVLGYINYKTFQFSKKKPEGCEDDENTNDGKMYKE
jgi:hypothetical protein